MKPEEKTTLWIIVAFILIAAICSVATASEQQTQFSVNATVTRRAELTYRNEPESIQITEGAIKYGTLEVLGSYYRVHTNSDTYILTFLPLTGVPITATINDKTKVLITSSPVDVVIVPKQSEDVVYVSYSITVPKKIEQGMYPFPIEVMAQ